MEKLDFRPPILKNIGSAFASPVTCLAAVCFLLAAVAGLLCLPLQPPVLALCTLWVLAAAALFFLYASAKNPKGMRSTAPALLSVLCLAQAVGLLALGMLRLLRPQLFPADLWAEASAAARIDRAYAAPVFWVLLVLALLCFLGFGLFFSAVGRTLRDGIPRRRGTGLLCLLSVVTAAAIGFIAVMYALSRDFNGVVRFGTGSPYRFISALPAVAGFLGTGFLCIAGLRYSGAVKRSNNV